MRRTLRRILVLLGLFFIVSFGVFIVNQTTQLVALVDRIHPLAGSILFWSLLALYAFCLFIPLYLLLTLPAPLSPPAADDEEAVAEHMRRLTRRLRRNPQLSGRALDSEVEVDAALGELAVRADELTKAAGSQVFVTTAISQNGSLDAILVLAAQSKLVWEIARLYYQRPTMRDLVYLYSNVAATAFIAGELEDLDLSEQVQPIVTNVLGSAAGIVPGLGAASTLFITSVTTGTANAFLTLRVGAIAKQYCRALVRPERRRLRRLATAQATAMLGGIALTGARRVAAAFGTASKRVVGTAVTEMGSDLKAASASLRESALVKRLRRINHWDFGPAEG